MTVPAWIFASDDGDSGDVGDISAKRLRLDQEGEPRLRLAADHPDRSLVDGVRASDKTAFEAIYRAYFESLSDFALIYCRRPDICGDLVNDVFANVWANRAEWSPEQGIGAYLRGAVRNRVRNFLRDAVRAEQRAQSWVLGEPSDIPAPDIAMELRETAARVWRAVERLPEGRRLVITLRWQQQLGISEIAAQLGVSEGAVRVQLSRALAQLRRMIPELFGG